MVVLQINSRDGKTRKIEVEQTGETLLQILRTKKIYFDAPCGGKGSCGKCKIRFLENAPQPTEQERQQLSKEELQKGIRLACAVVLTTSAVIELPEEAPNEQIILQSQIERIQEEECGIALDIGTTTLAAAVVSLRTGKIIATVTATNHQREYGADVMTRIQASNDGKGCELKNCICDDLRYMIQAILAQAKVLNPQVKKMTIAANTTMSHLLLGLSCETLGRAPFTPVDISLQKKTYAEIFKTEELNCEVTLLPGVSAFIGGDITAGILKGKFLSAKKVCMFLDIGTNGEMIIGNEDGLLAASTAAGPVFEGGNIACGAPAVFGAISHLKAVKDSFVFETIGDRPAIGLCGSAIVDMTSELILAGMVDETGMMKEEWFETGVSITDNLRFTQKDIREVQMGKAAIRAGIETLIEEYQCEPKEIYLAGGFGTYLDEEAAIRIGMFPETFRGRIHNLGNTALAGAIEYMLLHEADAAWQMEQIVKKTEEIELASHSKFAERYVQEMFFSL